MCAIQSCAHNRSAKSKPIPDEESSAASLPQRSASIAPVSVNDSTPRAVEKDSKFHVALDIGHSPKAAGAEGADGTMEYEFNRRIVHLIAADLNRQEGIGAMIINDEGKEISLARRSLLANQRKADLFLAVHHDSVNDKYLVRHKVGDRVLYECDKFHGYSVFFSRKNAKQDDSFAFAKLLGAAMRDEGLSPTAHHAEKIPGENRELVMPELGVYRFDNLVVLKTATMPAALLECGVIVNPSEEAELKGNERQQKTVEAVRKAVLAMAKSKTAASTAELSATENR
jgi:N-acetylmuramoyl-L-alanine amidase